MTAARLSRTTASSALKRVAVALEHVLSILLDGGKGGMLK
jgi:hypothetical protein